jgi:DNA-binding CsgD family transcriptional regulator
VSSTRPSQVLVMPMLALLSKSAAALSPPTRSAEPLGCGTSIDRAALVAPPGLFRDGFAHLIASRLADVRIECRDRVEDVVPGPARLALIAFNPNLCSREALRAKIETLRARCDGAPIGVLPPDGVAAAGLGALGAAGVVPLSASAEIAIAAVRLMLVGGYCLLPEAHPPVAPPSLRAAGQYAAPALQRQPRDADERVDDRHDLTARECDVLRSLRAGHPNKIIAFDLGISESTVKVHLRNIMKKMNASNRIQVALCGPGLYDVGGVRLRAAGGPRVSQAGAVRIPI